MAHNLEMDKNGKASFASTLKAWHDLGVIVDGAMTSEQAIKLANLDYTVETKPLFAKVDGMAHGDLLLPVANNFATVRTDKNVVLGVVGNRYKVVQNRDAFAFFDEIVGGKHAMFETAGVLGQGERIFVSAKMPDVIKIAGTDDISEVYVLLTSSHDGSGSIIAAVTPVRVVCQNTLNAALKSTVSRVAIRHTTNAKTKLAEAHKLLGISHAYINEVNEMFNALAKKSITDAQVKELVNSLWVSKKEVGTEEDAKESTRILNIKEAVMASYFSGVGQSQIIGTAWGAYNGITHYLDHIQNYKSGDKRFDSLMNGASAEIQNQAFAKLIAL
jgi:phage/plasmid-like protein (TIGR03299 family)